MLSGRYSAHPRAPKAWHPPPKSGNYLSDVTQRLGGRRTSPSSHHHDGGDKASQRSWNTDHPAPRGVGRQLPAADVTRLHAVGGLGHRGQEQPASFQERTFVAFATGPASANSLRFNVDHDQ